MSKPRVFPEWRTKPNKAFALCARRYSYTISVIFAQQSCRPSDNWVLYLEWENDPSTAQTLSLHDAILNRSYKGLPLYVVLYDGWRGLNRKKWPNLDQFSRAISIPDTVQELRTYCLLGDGHDFVSRITFGASSSLKSIGQGAFYLCAFKEITIPDSVEEIGERCFMGCDKLSRVRFGHSSSLKRIGKQAFHWGREDACPLTEIRIPRSVEILGDECFRCCMSLSKVTFDEASSLKSIGVSAFRCCSLVSIRIPDSVEVIGSLCFSFCKCLSRVKFGVGSSLKSIGSEAFRECTKLQEIRIPDPVQEICTACFLLTGLSRIVFGDLSSVKIFSPGGFSSMCTRAGCPLVEITIPRNVEEIGSRCFDGCEHLSRVSFSEPASLRIIGAWAFCKCALTEIRIPDRVEELGAHCFHKCKDLSRVSFSERSSLKCIGARCFGGCPLTGFVLPPGVRSAGGAFNSCNNPEGVNIQRCSHFTVSENLLLDKSGRVCWSCLGSLKEIVIPDQLKELRDGCFCRCVSLERVIFGKTSSLKCIGAKAFSRCSLTDIAIPDSVETLERKCFYDCQKLTVVTFGESSSLKRIGKDAFGGRSCGCPLTEFRVPDSVEELGKRCCFACRGLAVLTFGQSSSLKRIGKLAFGCLYSDGCVFTEVMIPAGVRELSDGCFENCVKLTSVTFAEPSSLKRIGPRAFSGCYKLAEIHIPDSVEELTHTCFFDAKQLSKVTFGERSSLKRIGPRVFCGDMGIGCSLVELTIPDKVITLGERAFFGCAWLKIVRFGKCSALKKIGPEAFSGCPGNPCALKEIIIPDSVEELCDKCFFNCKELSVVTFGESSSLKRIGVEAFSGLKGHECSLKAIRIPDRVEELAEKCFCNCTSLLSVTFGEASSLRRIGDQAFSGCCLLKKLDVPDSVEELGEHYFGECKKERRKVGKKRCSCS